MAHNNGRIYIDPNTTGVEIADLQQVLGRGTGDLGLLCSDQEWYDNGGTPTLRPLNPPRINKWAWHKPIRQSSYGLDLRNVTPPDDRFNGDQPVGEYCIGSLEIPYSQTLGTITQSSNTEGNVTVYKWEAQSGFFHDMMRGLYNWNYRRPRGVDGTHTEPFRIFDFVGYNHRCVSPMPTPPSGNFYVSEGGQVSMLVDLPTDLVTGNMMLSTMHLPAGLIAGSQPTLSSFYVGILLYRPNYEDCVWKTATAAIGTSSAQNTNRRVSFSSFKSIGTIGGQWNKIGTWYARTFLSNIQLNEGQIPSTENQVFVMASEEVTEIRFTSGTITNEITITVKRAKWVEAATGNPSQIRVSATVRNGYVHDAAMSNIRMSVSSGDEVGDPEHYYHDEYIFDDPDLATIPMLDEQSYTHVFNNVPYEVGKFTIADFSCTAVVNGETKYLSFFADLTPLANNPTPELT